MIVHKLTFIVFLLCFCHNNSLFGTNNSPNTATNIAIDNNKHIKETTYNFDYLVHSNPTLASLIQDAPFTIVLIGVVLDKDKQPVKGVEVALKTVQTGEKINFTTQKDGSFYFRLEADALYQVELLNEQISKPQSFNLIKEIVTAGIHESRILHTLMELP